MLTCFRRLFIITLLALGLLAPLGARANGPMVFVGRVDGAINPAAADYIARLVAEGERSGAVAVIIELDTPGGLVSSTWNIGETLLNAKVPVVVYVSPSGATAGSAGVFITYAAHIAAMAPNSNIGAAHPVAGGGEDIDGDLRDKITNDAVAKITTWARANGRNAEWGESAVRESVSIGSDEALKLNVVNIIATDVNDLVAQLDGLEVTLPQGEVEIDTDGVAVERVEMSFIERLLHFVADPNITYLLMGLAMLAFYFELTTPGVGLGGMLGTVALLLSLYGNSVLPVNYAGLALLVFAMILFGVDIFATNHGALTIGGIVAFVAGSLLLFKPSEMPGLALSFWLVLGTSAGILTVVLMLAFMLVRGRRTGLAMGEQGLIGQIAEVRTPLSPEGSVFIDGALWRARAAEPLRATHVRVSAVDGLTLLVEPLEVLEPAPAGAEAVR